MTRSSSHTLVRPAFAAAPLLCLAWLACAPSVRAQAPGAIQPPSLSAQPADAPAQPPLPLEPVAPEAVFAVPDWLDALVRTRVVEATSSRDKRVEKLVELLFGDQGLALRYDGATTRTISEAAEGRMANCLSFALMFVALARRAGIEAYVQETDRVLVWQGSGALYGNGHVNVGVRIGGSRKTVDIDSSVISIRGVPRAISDARALSHYYNNRGAELMAAGRLQEARRQLSRAIELTPDFIGAWNNLGVLETREGALERARRAYAKALQIDPRHSPTLSNMINLFRRVGDAKRQAEFERRLFHVQRRDPFHQILLAMGYERAGDYTAAVEHYRRALRLKAKEHFVYFGLARAYAHLGDIRRATDALVHARDAAGDKGGIYQAKLNHLRRLRSH